MNTFSKDLLWVVLAYIFAFLSAVLVILITQDQSRLLKALYADVGATLVIFGFGSLFRNSSFYDPYWSDSPPMLLLYWASDLILSDPRMGLLFLITLLWSLRLTYNWMRNWSGLDHEDWRYRNFRKATGVLYPLADLFGIHIAPTLIVFLGCLPFYWLSSSDAIAWSLWIYSWVPIGLVGIYLEMRADNVLREFRVTNNVRGKFLDYDVWALCRHPNYLGELSFWFVIGMAGFLGTAESKVWIGFIAMLALFVLYSVPALDKKLLASKEGYDEYKKNVPSLIPIGRWKPKTKEGC